MTVKDRAKCQFQLIPQLYSFTAPFNDPSTPRGWSFHYANVLDPPVSARSPVPRIMPGKYPTGIRSIFVQKVLFGAYSTRRSNDHSILSTRIWNRVVASNRVVAQGAAMLAAARAGIRPAGLFAFRCPQHAQRLHLARRTRPVRGPAELQQPSRVPGQRCTRVPEVGGLARRELPAEHMLQGALLPVGAQQRPHGA